jgi:hypothetical protein
VLYGYTSAEGSQLHWLSALTGEDRVLFETTEIVHDAVWEPATGRAVFVLLGRASRQPIGIFQTDLSGAPPRQLSQGWTFASDDGSSLSHVLLLSTRERRLAVVSCAAAGCELRVGRDVALPTPPAVVASGLPDRVVFGLAGGRLLMGSVCAPPCAATAVDLTTGQRSDAGLYCHTAVAIDDPAEPVLVSDVTERGTCPDRGYEVRATSLASGRTWQPYVSSTEEPKLAPPSGWELPRGWVLLGPVGQVASPEAGAVPTLAIRVTDGYRVALPRIATP